VIYIEVYGSTLDITISVGYMPGRMVESFGVTPRRATQLRQDMQHRYEASAVTQLLSS
jgi:hypothetical protein